MSFMLRVWVQVMSLALHNPKTHEPQLCYLLIAARDVGCGVPGNSQITPPPTSQESGNNLGYQLPCCFVEY